MNAYDASEQAYKRGYEQGKKDARKKGRWEDAGKNIHGQNLTRCTRCKGTSIEGGLFCRNCGADMRGEEDG